MRKSIYEIVNENKNIDRDIERIIALFQQQDTIFSNTEYTTKNYTVRKFVEIYCFNNWACRGHCINIDDFFETIDFNTNIYFAKSDMDSFFTIVEAIYSFWYLAEKKSKYYIENKSGNFLITKNFYLLKNILDDMIGEYNCKAYFDDEKECVIVIEDKQEVTAVAEILPSQLATNVIKYNHRLLKGDIELKKSILWSMGNDLESKRQKLQNINNQLCSDIFFMLNNMNIRHNNTNVEDQTKYKKCIDEMTYRELEEWYDELYQMMLIAFLLLDNMERTEKIKELKKKIVEGK